MTENFRLNSYTKWNVDLSDDTKVKQSVTLCRRREQVEVLEIEMIICVDEDSTNRLIVTYSTPNPRDTMVLEVASRYTQKLCRELYEYLGRLNRWQ